MSHSRLRGARARASRILPISLATLVACAVLATLAAAAPAEAAQEGATPSAGITRAQQAHIADADRDRIPDEVEISVCGTKTCATGLEDRDGDGIPDWVEMLSCGDRTCANATKDRDGDGIPDFAERLVCDGDTCSNSTEDADGDGIGDWVEFVICGDRTCASGAEDYDGDGISDAVQLAACVKRVDPLALTGQPWFWWVLTTALAALTAGGWMLWRRGRGAPPGDPGGEVEAAAPVTGAER